MEPGVMRAAASSIHLLSPECFRFSIFIKNSLNECLHGNNDNAKERQSQGEAENRPEGRCGRGFIGHGGVGGLGLAYLVFVLVDKGVYAFVAELFIAALDCVEGVFLDLLELFNKGVKDLEPVYGYALDPFRGGDA
jgi:hypothetical protein